MIQLSVELEHIVYWAIKKLNFELNASKERRISQLNDDMQWFKLQPQHWVDWSRLWFGAELELAWSYWWFGDWMEHTHKYNARGESQNLKIGGKVSYKNFNCRITGCTWRAATTRLEKIFVPIYTLDWSWEN